MSIKFRPVLEQWGAFSNCFVSHDSLLRILEVIADETIENDYQGSYFEVSHREDVDRVWILCGKSFLAFLQSAVFTAQWLADHMEGDDADLSDISSVVENMKTLAPEWYASLDSEDSLRFYVDLF
jgi:hypothetical protein